MPHDDAPTGRPSTAAAAHNAHALQASPQGGSNSLTLDEDTFGFPTYRAKRAPNNRALPIGKRPPGSTAAQPPPTIQSATTMSASFVFTEQPPTNKNIFCRAKTTTRRKRSLSTILAAAAAIIRACRRQNRFKKTRFNATNPCARKTQTNVTQISRNSSMSCSTTRRHIRFLRISNYNRALFFFRLSPLLSINKCVYFLSYAAAAAAQRRWQAFWNRRFCSSGMYKKHTFC